MTYHSVQRTEERAKLNEEASIRLILRAKERGRTANDFTSKEQEYLINKAGEDSHAVVYNGFCFIMSNTTDICITMFALPKWFEKKGKYVGKMEIRNPKKYYRNYPDTLNRTGRLSYEY